MIRFAPLLVALTVFVTTLAFRAQVNSQVADELSSKAFIDRILSSTGKLDPNATTGVWFNKNVGVPTADLAAALLDSASTNVLGTSSDKWIEVDLTTQHLYAHEGGRVVFDFPISSGLPWFPTATGEFHIWAKLRSQEMIGGSRDNGTYYDLPNVPFIQYFYNGYGLHGAYWHHDFGHPRSHGCVNIDIADSEKLFNWTDPQLAPGQSAVFNIDPSVGTRVVVHGTTPAP
ncbi:MAG: L,D-transpeptidase [Patescibacteria group bacterium]|nr:L,D-transpeptidase [Patescibacteria group bacterium]MCL5431520.1 L,D-transpeptidase [Patescibacteria group bacterium]